MFEEMAEEYRKDLMSRYCFSELQLNLACQGFRDGYNKALEEATHNYNAIIADYDKRIAELEKENAELKEREIKSEMFPEIILPKGSSEFIDKIIVDAEKRIKESE